MKKLFLSLALTASIIIPFSLAAPPPPPPEPLGQAVHDIKLMFAKFLELQNKIWEEEKLMHIAELNHFADLEDKLDILPILYKATKMAKDVSEKVQS